MGSCDFERGDLCTWKQENSGNDDWDWSLNKGSTGSVGTGPEGDHTLGDERGRYIYLESSRPAREGDTAKIYSPTFTDWGHRGRSVHELTTFPKSGKTRERKEDEEKEENQKEEEEEDEKEKEKQKGTQTATDFFFFFFFSTFFIFVIFFFLVSFSFYHLFSYKPIMS